MAPFSSSVPASAGGGVTVNKSGTLKPNRLNGNHGSHFIILHPFFSPLQHVKMSPAEKETFVFGGHGVILIFFFSLYESILNEGSGTHTLHADLYVAPCWTPFPVWQICFEDPGRLIGSRGSKTKISFDQRCTHVGSGVPVRSFK